MNTNKIYLISLLGALTGGLIVLALLALLLPRLMQQMMTRKMSQMAECGCSMSEN
jgi:hypothetical protein